jgi:alpha-1,3-rhamnosyl/mannosyltransferase
VLFVGTLEPRKNVGTLLDAYERLLARRATPELVLAGQATAESRPWLDRIGRAPLVGRVRHIGYVDPSARRALFEGARVLIQPSFEEGFGLPVLEAMTIGAPVVAADRGALPEVLGDAGLLVDPLQADAVASGLERMLDDTAFAASCAARGTERAREFRWSDTAARVYRVYQLAIDRRAERMSGAHRD